VDEPEAGAEFETVGEFREVFEAELAALRLREAGLEAHVLDQSFRQEPLPNVRSFAIVRVLVPRASAEAARRLLAQPVEMPEDVAPAEDDEPSS
jgi:hypothetical protein